MEFLHNSSSTEPITDYRENPKLIKETNQCLVKYVIKNESENNINKRSCTQESKLMFIFFSTSGF